MRFSFNPAFGVDPQILNKFTEPFLRVGGSVGLIGIVGACKSSLVPRSTREQASADKLAAVSAGKPDEVQARLPTLGKPAPVFSGTAVVNREFKQIKLKNYKGKYVVLLFYPLDFTFVCPTELIAFSDAFPEFQKLNCQVIAASTDSQFGHFAWMNTPRREGGLGDMNIPLLSDKSGKIARAYGIYDEDSGVPWRGLFIIDDKQRLRQITINDHSVGRSVDETLRLVQAFQHSDKHGEGCPAGWTPGSRTIKPNPEGAKKYFQSAH